MSPPSRSESDTPSGRHFAKPPSTTLISDVRGRSTLVIVSTPLFTRSIAAPAVAIASAIVAS